jgi:hypothetical protein
MMKTLAAGATACCIALVGLTVSPQPASASALSIKCTPRVSTHTARVSCSANRSTKARFRVVAKYCDRGYSCWTRTGAYVPVNGRFISSANDKYGYTALSQVSWEIIGR